MAKTLPLLTATASIADDTLMLVRRAGQTSDESALASVVKAYMFTNPTITGATINNSIIGGTTPAAATFTNVVATTVNKVTITQPATGSTLTIANGKILNVVDSLTVNKSTVLNAASIVLNSGGNTQTFPAATDTLVGRASTDVLTNKTYDTAGTGNVLKINGTQVSAVTGTGAVVLATSPSLVTPDIGTPSSGVATNLTGLPLTSGVTGQLPIANGGTNATTAATARTNLGLAIGTNVEAWSAQLDTFAALTNAADTMPYFQGTGLMGVTALTSVARTLLAATTQSGQRTALGLGDMATQTSSSVSITGGTITGITDLAVADGGTGASTATGARSNLGLGDMATQTSSSVSITGGTITGITDLAVADGGTGASTAANARTNLGLAIGTNVEAWSAQLDTVAALAVTKGNVYVGNGTTIVAVGVGSNNQVLTADSTQSAGVKWAAAASAPTYATFQDQKTSGTAGGSATSGSWFTRTINTTVQNGISGASLASNQITLPAGTYDISAWGANTFAQSHQIRLQNITAGSTAILGVNTSSSNASGSPVATGTTATLADSITIAGSTVFELQHRVEATRTTDGLGRAGSWGTEVYSEVKIAKVA